MIEIDSTKRRNMGISRLSTFIERHLYDTDWILVAITCGVIDILNESKHEGLRRAQYFGNPYYVHGVYNFLADVFRYNEQTGLFLINEIIAENKLNEEQETELKNVLKFFCTDNTDTILSSITLLDNNNRFIDLLNYPDDFYKTLVDEINFQYINKHLISLSILIRKLFENLIIDILRKKYNTTDLNVYYDTSKGRFHDFSVLLKNLDLRQEEFHYVSPNLDSKFIKELNKYRDAGNSSAHSIDVNITIDDFSLKRDDISQKVKFLVRILNNV
jgi:hypothetical protein